MVVPYVLVITEPHPGIAVSARPFSSCGRLSHNGRNIVSCYMCYRCVPFDIYIYIYSVYISIHIAIYYVAYMMLYMIYGILNFRVWAVSKTSC